MRIAILVTFFPPRWIAGTEIATYNIAKHLARRGHEVHVITRYDSGLPRVSFEKGFYVHRINAPKSDLEEMTIYVLRELMLIRSLKPDIVHAQSIRRGLACVLAKKLFKIPCVVWGQGSDVYLPWRFKSFYSKIVLSEANVLIALTEYMKRKMIKLLGKERNNIFVLPNGIDLELFSNYSEKNINNMINLKKNFRIILYVGRLEPVKGVKYLIESLVFLKNKGISNVKLLIIGEGTYRKFCEELVKKLHLEDFVVFLGSVPHEEVPAYMALADVLVLPSLSEGFGIVLLEAMAMGLPIIATKVTGLTEIVEDGENGFLVEPHNPLEIAEKCYILLTNDDIRNKISENNRKKAKKYEWKKIIDKLEKIYFYTYYSSFSEKDSCSLLVT